MKRKPSNIKRKIILGFLSIGILLLISGLLSSLELVRFQGYTQQVLQLNHKSSELSSRLLDAIQRQNISLLQNITDTTTDYNRTIEDARKDFENLHLQALTLDPNNQLLIKVTQAKKKYDQQIDSIKVESMGVAWFNELYRTHYADVSKAIKAYIVDSQVRLIGHTEELNANAYRSTMVGIIALISGGILMFMFYYMIRKFFLDPLQLIQKSLSKYLQFNLPYEVNIDTKDEIFDLNDKISQVINKTNKAK